MQSSSQFGKLCLNFACMHFYRSKGSDHIAGRDARFWSGGESVFSVLQPVRCVLEVEDRYSKIKEFCSNRPGKDIEVAPRFLKFLGCSEVNIFSRKRSGSHQAFGFKPLGFSGHDEASELGSEKDGSSMAPPFCGARRAVIMVPLRRRRVGRHSRSHSDQSGDDILPFTEVKPFRIGGKRNYDDSRNHQQAESQQVTSLFHSRSLPSAVSEDN